MRGKHRPWSTLCAAFVGALTIAAVVPATPEAAGGSYNLLRCHDAAGRYTQAGEMQGQNGYSAVDKCQQTVADWSYQMKSYDSVGSGRRSSLSWSAPAGTAITGLSMDVDMRTADHHYAEIQVGSTVLYRAPNAAGPFTHFSQRVFPSSTARVLLYCADSSGCPASPEAHAFVRNVSIELTDTSDPSLTNAGDLITSGWKRGPAKIAAVSTDVGSGVQYVDVQVNGVGLGAPSSINCNGQIPRYTIYAPPCGIGSIDFTPDTGSHPFHNGANTVQVVGKDFAGNTTWSPEYKVMVDNRPPDLAFTNGQDSDDPELIRAAISDAHSGVASARVYMRAVGDEKWQPLDARIESGQVRARVDSSALPPGAYEFKAEAADVAGNVVATTLRANGQPMRLSFPLRDRVDLEAHLDGGGPRGATVPYGTATTVHGRLLDDSGSPVADREVLVVEHFGDGALIRERPTTVRTDADGRFTTKVPAGPTRHISAGFAGTRKYRAADADVGQFTVRSRATFELVDDSVPEGGTATFKGKVAHHGARIPAGGKLVELQVRVKTGRWETVGQAFRTKENGRYVRHYRFGKQYAQDALFHFRVKIQREGNWPYKRATSPQRKLIVQAR